MNEIDGIKEQLEWQTHFLKKLYEGFDSNLKQPSPGEQVIPGYNLEKINESILKLQIALDKQTVILDKRLGAIQFKVNVIAGVVGVFYAYMTLNGFFKW